MPNSKQIVYLSQSQYAELIANGEITVDGVTVTYNENDIYVTPQAEPVTDVRVAGISVAGNGIANIPVASASVLGVVKIPTLNDNFGINITNNSTLQIQAAIPSQIKRAAGAYVPIVPKYQNYSTFYGLAEAAGHDEKDSTEPVGTYTPEAKGAVQQMLGVSDLIAPSENNLVASKAYAIGDIFTANGKLYKATAAIAANEAIILQNNGEEVAGANAIETKVGEGFVKFTDYATTSTPGVVKVLTDKGITLANGTLNIYSAGSSNIKTGTNSYFPIVPNKQHESTFYGLAKAAGADEKDSTLPVGEYTDTAKSAIRTMLGAVGTEDYATASTAGIVRVHSQYGLTMVADNAITIQPASEAELKAGATGYKPISPHRQHIATFYGLAKASGDTTQSASSNAVGTYTDNAKASIKSMLGIQDGSTGTVDVTGTTPTITAVENTRYVCGEVTSLNFTPAASGICIVRFTSGSTVTVLTLPSTIKFPEWFDPTTLEANTIYEICITDGVYGAVMSWAQ